MVVVVFQNALREALLPANYKPLSQIVAAEAPECQPISEPAQQIEERVRRGQPRLVHRVRVSLG